jgi:hypothetical protein
VGGRRVKGSERQRPRHRGRRRSETARRQRQTDSPRVCISSTTLRSGAASGGHGSSNLDYAQAPDPGQEHRRDVVGLQPALHACTSGALHQQYISNALLPGPAAAAPVLANCTPALVVLFTATQHRIAASTGGHHHDSPCHDCPPLAAQMTDRRSSAAPAPKIPPAPPPPPPKQRHRSYFERFVAQPLTTAYGSGSRPSSVQANRPAGGPPNPLVPRLPGYVGISFIPPCLTCFYVCCMRAACLRPVY